MRRLFYAVTLLAIVVFAGCTEAITDPTVTPIVGTWKASNTGAAFPGSNIEFTFGSGSTVEVDGTTGGDMSGTFTTAASSSTPSIREITMTMTSPTSMTMKGIYEINGSEMKLEVVPTSASGVTAPYPEGGIGSTEKNGSKTNEYITVLQKQ